MTKNEDEKLMIARFNANILPALWPMVKYSRKTEQMLSGEVFCEPCAIGGVMVGAISNQGMVVYRDPNGAASSAMTLSIPKQAFKSCKPPKPLDLYFEGDRHDVNLPEWAQPKEVVCINAGIWVSTKMRHPQWAEETSNFTPLLYDRIANAASQTFYIGKDYQCIPQTIPMWRKPLLKAMENGVRKDPSFSTLNPALAGLFYAPLKRAKTLYGFEDTCCTFAFCGGTKTAANDEKNTGGAVLVTISTDPNFIGCFMPMKDTAVGIPDWFVKKVEDVPTTVRQ